MQRFWGTAAEPRDVPQKSGHRVGPLIQLKDSSRTFQENMDQDQHR